jgi:hypothetical protein
MVFNYFIFIMYRANNLSDIDDLLRRIHPLLIPSLTMSIILFYLDLAYSRLAPHHSRPITPHTSSTHIHHWPPPRPHHRLLTWLDLISTHQSAWEASVCNRLEVVPIALIYNVHSCNNYKYYLWVADFVVILLVLWSTSESLIVTRPLQ